MTNKSKPNKNGKPTLIIGCSDKKLPYVAKAIHCYQGNMFSLLHKTEPQPTQLFNILIFSAKHGLIEADKLIEPYDMRMPPRKDTAATQRFTDAHRVSALRLLQQASKQHGTLYVALTNDYLACFDAMLTDQTIKRFESVYISRNHNGIGELRGRLKRIVQLEQRSRLETIEQSPTFYRSGIANMSETGFIQAGNDVGTSLAYCNTTKNTALLNTLLESTKSGRLFFDNGLITQLNKTGSLDLDYVFNQYDTIINSLPRKQARNVTIVVPDDVSCNDNAVNIVQSYADRILNLASKCRVIVPIHRSKDMKAHCLNMLTPLKFHKNIVVGIPCLEKKEANLALNLSEIDALLSTKKSSKDKAITQIHFFGMSERTAPSKLNSRLLLARLHGVSNENISLDACRTTASFGYTKRGLRKGSAEVERIKDKHIEKQVVQSEPFINHQLFEENHSDNAHDFVLGELYDLINEDDIEYFWLAYCEALRDYPALQVNANFSDNEIDDSIEMAWRMVSQKAVEAALFESLKHDKWQKFRFFVQTKELDSKTARFEAIRNLFKTNSENVVQMQLEFVA